MVAVVEVDDRVPAGALVARRAQAVERHRVRGRDRALLLEEAADHPLLHRVENGEAAGAIGLSSMAGTIRLAAAP